MKVLRDKVAVVTGAASGIGRGIARALAAEGCHVVVADVDGTGADTVARELARSGVDASGHPLDVTDRDAIEDLADQTWQRFGHVDICVNNAGVFPPMGPLIDQDEGNVRWVMDVNVMGTWYGCSAFGRRFQVQATEAHILNVGSENSLGLPNTGAGFYTASKHAVLALSDVLRWELPEYIGVSVLCPGMVATNLSASTTRRPERFGGPFGGATRPMPGLDPNQIGDRAVEGIKRGDFYILTHPPVRRIVDERYQELARAFDTQAPRYDGDDAIDTRARLPLRRPPGAGRPRPPT